MNAFNSFDTSKSHAVDIHLETLTLKLIAIARRRIIGFNELSPTNFTQVILFTSLLAVPTGTG